MSFFVYILGSEGGLLSSDVSVTRGIVSNLSGPGDDRRIMQITAPVQPGNSGGPVLDASGSRPRALNLTATWAEFPTPSDV